MQPLCYLILAVIEISDSLKDEKTPMTLTKDNIRKIEEKFSQGTFIPYLYTVLQLQSQDNLSIKEQETLFEKSEACLEFLDKVHGFLGVKHNQVQTRLLLDQLK